MKRLLLFYLIFVCALSLNAQVPQQISFQGRLSNDDGSIVADGEYLLTFRLYDSPTGTAVLWNESINTTISNGLFSVMLGNVVPFDGVDFGTPLWISVQIGDDTELYPRYQMGSSPYSLHSVLADRALSVSWENITDMPEGFADDIDDEGNWIASGIDISNSNIGFVGIGTDSPDADLHVDGDVHITGNLIVDGEMSDNIVLVGDNVSLLMNDVGYLTEERDPYFTASPAATIEEDFITKWHTAYAWGNHALAGYLTEELDPLYSGSPAATILSDDINNWNLAFAWGNHADAGYLTEEEYYSGIISTISIDDINSWNEAFGWGNHSEAGYLTFESDPIFTSSPSYGIADIDIFNWSSAFRWGDHSLEGYLTEEHDPHFTSSPANTITTENITDWNNAFSWGDHAEEGYLTSESDPIFTSSAAAGITLDLMNEWNEAYRWGNHADAGYIFEEMDPQVGTNVLNHVPIWDGSKLVNGSIYDNGNNVGIGVTTPSPSAILDISSPNKGLLVPRMNTVARDGIVMPHNGLMIFNTDCNNFNYYSVDQWLSFPNILDITLGMLEGSGNVCIGAEDEVYSVEDVAESYEWSVPEGSVITSGEGTNSITVTFGAYAGEVCVRAIGACGSADRCKMVYINPNVEPPSEPVGITTRCMGAGSDEYYITAVDGATSYSWYISGGNSITPTTTSLTNTVEWDPTFSGTATLSVRTNGCGGPSAWTSIDIVVSPATVGGMITGGGPACSGIIFDELILTDYTGEILRWQKSSNGGSTWINIAHTEPSYSEILTSGSWIYRATVQSGFCGEEYSAVSAPIEIFEAPVIVEDPEDYNGESGDYVTFAVTATGSDLRYQWQLSTNDGVSWSNVGGDSDSYSLTIYEEMAGHLYRCIVSNEGCPPDTSDNAEILFGLYEFTTHTFTNCGKTGREGPSESQCESAYSATVWASDDDLFNVVNGIQEWAVPNSGSYRIEVAGAGYGGMTYQKGAVMTGTFELEVGDVLRILVGQQATGICSGSGGTFVELSGGPLLIAAGGNGGVCSSSNTYSGTLATTSTTGQNGNVGSGGTGGNGGNSACAGSTYGGGGGGGYLSDGLDNSTSYGCPGYGFASGGQGGYNECGDYVSSEGGFGGGGSGYASCEPAGGGGYSGGGGGGAPNHCGGSSNRFGGGGGSYNSGTDQTASVTRIGHGYVTITYMP